MSELISKKYVNKEPVTPPSHVQSILDAPVKREPSIQKEEKLPTVTETITLSCQSITDVITLLSSLPLVGGKLPDKVILAIGKLHGALAFLRK